MRRGRRDGDSAGRGGRRRGPVGLAAALYAVRSGLSVVVLEPREGVVDKACGEGLMPGGFRRCLGWGSRRSAATWRGSGTWQERAWRRPTSPTAQAAVRRTVLHERLRAALAAAGERCCRWPQPMSRRPVSGCACGPARGGRAVGPDLFGRYVLAADGLHSPTRRALGLQAPIRGPQRFGQRRHHTRPWSSHVEVHWGRHGEAYVTPVADDLVGVAVLSARRATFAEQLGEFPVLRERLVGASAATAVRGAGPLRQRAARQVAGRVLLVGDAAGVDALTGEDLAGPGPRPGLRWRPSPQTGRWATSGSGAGSAGGRADTRWCRPPARRGRGGPWCRWPSRCRRCSALP